MNCQSVKARINRFRSRVREVFAGFFRAILLQGL
jgi:hypothetical protein